jgi:hypothetical protein
MGSRDGTLDSRVRLTKPRGVKRLVRHLGVLLWGEPVYCLSCGSQDGWVTHGLPPGVFYLCGGCETKYGVPEEFHRRPDLDEARMT